MRTITRGQQKQVSLEYMAKMYLFINERRCLTRINILSQYKDLTVFQYPEITIVKASSVNLFHNILEHYITSFYGGVLCWTLVPSGDILGFVVMIFTTRDEVPLLWPRLSNTSLRLVMLPLIHLRKPVLSQMYEIPEEEYMLDDDYEYRIYCCLEILCHKHHLTLRSHDYTWLSFIWHWYIILTLFTNWQDYYLQFHCSYGNIKNQNTAVAWFTQSLKQKGLQFWC